MDENAPNLELKHSGICRIGCRSRIFDICFVQKVLLHTPYTSSSLLRKATTARCYRSRGPLFPCFFCTCSRCKIVWQLWEYMRIWPHKSFNVDSYIIKHFHIFLLICRLPIAERYVSFYTVSFFCSKVKYVRHDGFSLWSFVGITQPKLRSKLPKIPKLDLFNEVLQKLRWIPKT